MAPKCHPQVRIRSGGITVSIRAGVGLQIGQRSEGRWQQEGLNYRRRSTRRGIPGPRAASAACAAEQQQEQGGSNTRR